MERPSPRLNRPAGCRVDLDFLHAVATETNAAHKALGTQLLDIERHAVTIALEWRADLVAETGRSLMNGVLATLLDHACSLAAYVSFNEDYRHGGTLGLRVEYLRPSRAGEPVHVRAVCEEILDAVALVRGVVIHPDRPSEPLAIGHCTIAIAA